MYNTAVTDDENDGMNIDCGSGGNADDADDDDDDDDGDDDDDVFRWTLYVTGRGSLPMPRWC